jgi:hypothetical protein
MNIYASVVRVFANKMPTIGRPNEFAAKQNANRLGCAFNSEPAAKLRLYGGNVDAFGRCSPPTVFVHL